MAFSFCQRLAWVVPEAGYINAPPQKELVMEWSKVCKKNVMDGGGAQTFFQSVTTASA
jgi:hypothetical protein